MQTHFFRVNDYLAFRLIRLPFFRLNTGFSFNLLDFFVGVGGKEVVFQISYVRNIGQISD
jgi:hypothetical protein